MLKLGGFVIIHSKPIFFLFFLTSLISISRVEINCSKIDKNPLANRPQKIANPRTIPRHWLGNHSVPNQNQSPIVSVIQGKIRGKVEHSRLNQPFASYLGIPYASPPGMFRLATEPESWSDKESESETESESQRENKSENIRDGTYYRQPCVQPNQWKNGTIGSLDCLYLNIFVKTLEPSSKRLLPVLVFLEGENFQTSQPPGTFGPENLLDEDIILVTLSYRLGIFGFLTITSNEKGNKYLPKNLGLKDQVMALKWIEANIHVFGGDRMRITLFGSGSGAISISLHLMSPMSSGLFTNAISQSGSALCPNSIVLDPDLFARELGSHFNCTTNSSVSTFERCIGGKNVTELIQFQIEATGWERGKLQSPLGPVVELMEEVDPDSEDEEDTDQNIFLPDYPENILKDEKLPRNYPWIVGVNSKAGHSSHASIIRRDSEALEKLNEDWEKFAPLLFGYSQSSYNQTYISKKVRQFYFQDEERIDDSNWNHLFDAANDQLFFQCVKRSALLYGKSAPLYLYYFTYEKINFGPTPSDQALTSGLNILNTELQYFFKLSDSSKKQSPGQTQKIPHTVSQELMRRSPSFRFSRSLIKLWTSFAKNGTPVDTFPRPGSWLPLSKSEVDGKSPLKWYHLDFETKYMSEPFFPQVNFWHSLGTNRKLENIMSQYSTLLKQRIKKRNLKLAKRARKNKAASSFLSVEKKLVQIGFTFCSYLLFCTFFYTHD